MPDPQFDPSRPFTVESAAAPAFDPTRPFTLANDKPPNFTSTNEKDATGKPVVRDILNAAVAAEQQRTQSGADFLKGIGKSALGTIEGGGQLLRSVPVIGPLLSRGPQVPLPVSTAPANPSERLGKTVGDIGQFFLPAATLGRAKAAFATGHGVLDALVGAGLEATSATGVTAAQQGSMQGAGKTFGLTAGTNAALGGTLKAAQLGGKALGERIEAALLKPTTAASEGLTPSQLVQRVYKYDVGGTLGQTYDKVSAKISGLTNQLRAVLQSSAQQGAGVSLNTIAQDTAQSYLNNPQAVTAIGRILDHIEFGLNKLGISAGTGVLNVADANVAKQAVGEMGAWLSDISGRTVSDADKVTEEVANRFYDTLKTAVEQNATSGPVKAINRQIADLIPIKTAVIRRIPVAERANVIGIADMFGLSAHTLGISLANRVLNSGPAANVLVQASGLPTSGVVNAVTRGVASQTR